MLFSLTITKKPPVGLYTVFFQVYYCWEKMSSPTISRWGPIQADWNFAVAEKNHPLARSKIGPLLKKIQPITISEVRSRPKCDMVLFRRLAGSKAALPILPLERRKMVLLSCMEFHHTCAYNANGQNWKLTWACLLIYLRYNATWNMNGYLKRV